MNDEDSGYTSNTDYLEYSDCHYEMEHWRWCDELSVVEAAMLVVGMNPSVYEPHSLYRIEEGQFHEIGQPNDTSTYRNSREFIPVFKAISRAALRDEFECQMSYIMDENEGGLGATNSLPQRLPDWTNSLLMVDTFKAWMANNDRKPMFFFPPDKPERSAFLDCSHEHFSAELYLAVKVWSALETESRFPRGIKSAIEKWIDDNRSHWLGDSELSTNAKERITTLVNWKKGGGAPASGE